MNQKKNKPRPSSRSPLLYDTEFKWRYLKPRYWATWLAAAFLGLMILVPASIQDAMANKLGDLMRSINKKRRRIARKNIQQCFPEFSEQQKKQMLRENFRHQARSVLHLGIIWWAPRWLLRKRIVVQGQENIEKSQRENHGVIVMPAHSMGLEAVLSAVAMRYISSGFFKPLKNELLDWLVARARVRHGGYSYARDAGLRPIIKDVRAGCVALYLSDEDLGPNRSIFAPFFGTQKASVPVLGRLAKSCRAHVLPSMTCYNKKTHQYVVHILPPLQNFPSGDDYQDTLQMNKALEELIGLCPSQYFWIMKMFKTRPEGEAAFYD